MTDSPLARYLVPIRRWWWVVLAVLAITLASGVLTLPDDVELTEEQLAELAAQFRATHILIVNEDASEPIAFDLIMLLSQQGDLTNRVVDAMDGQVEASDVESVELVPDLNTATLTITAIQDTPSDAEELANVYAEELVSFLDERSEVSAQRDLRRVTEQLQDVEAQIDEIQAQIVALGVDDPDRVLLQARLDGLLDEFSRLTASQQSLSTRAAGLEASFLTLQEPSSVPVGDEAGVLALPASPPLRFGVLGLLGLLLGLVIVLAIDYLDTRIRTRRDAEEVLGLPVIAELPGRRKRHRTADPLPALNDPAGVTAEVMRALALSIDLAPTWHLASHGRDAGGVFRTKSPNTPHAPPQTIVVTSPRTGDGKSTVVANLAVSMAEGGKRVLVVDCDFRRPAVGAMLETQPGKGLRDLEQVEERPLVELASVTAAARVTMIRAGSEGVTPAWFRGGVQELVVRCSQVADIVIFDTGPISLTNEASALLPHVDTSLLVVRAGKVAGDQARQAIEQLTQVGANISGVVLVGAESRRRYGYYTSATKIDAAPTDGSAAGDGSDISNSKTADKGDAKGHLTTNDATKNR